MPERDFHVATVVRNRVVVFGGRSDTFAPYFTANDIYPNEFFFYELGNIHFPYNATDAGHEIITVIPWSVFISLCAYRLSSSRTFDVIIQMRK